MVRIAWLAVSFLKIKYLLLRMLNSNVFSLDTKSREGGDNNAAPIKPMKTFHIERI